MSSHMKTIIYEKLHQNLRGAVHLLGERKENDPILVFKFSVNTKEFLANGPYAWAIHHKFIGY